METSKKSLESSSNKTSAQKVKSSKFRIGAKTFYFDVNLASNNKRYLKITESRFIGEGEDKIRNSVIIFPEALEDFQKNLKEIVGYL